jgi:hypothetical protein
MELLHWQRSAVCVFVIVCVPAIACLFVVSLHCLRYKRLLKTRDLR